MPQASTPTTRRTCSGEAAAIPISLAISCVGEPRHRCFAFERVLGLDPDLGPQRLLALDDMSGDVLGEGLDEEGLTDHDVIDRLPEELGKARHVHAFLPRIEIDRARDLRGERLLVPLVPDANRFLHAGHSGPRQAELDLGDGSLQVAGPAVPHLCHRVQPYRVDAG